MNCPSRLTSWKLIKTIWPLIAIVLALVAMAATSLAIMSSVRAYIGGESMWSKGQKDAVFYLHYYATTGDERAYAQYLDAIAYPRNLKRARLALQTPDPNVAVAREALAASGIDRADVDEVIWVFRTFRRVGYFAQALGFWTRGDQLVDQLAVVGERLHALSFLPGASRNDANQLTDAIWRINAEISPISRAFADVLGAAFRQMALFLLVSNLVVAAILVVLSAFCSRRFIVARLKVEDKLRRSEARAQATLGSLGEAVISVGPIGLVEFVNPAAESLLGLESAHCIGRPLGALVTLLREGDRRPIDLIGTALSGAECQESGRDLILTDTRGVDTVVQAVTSVVYDPTQSPSGVVLLLRNMTREREYISTLAWQATHDSLTGLLNRSEFERRLDASLDPHSKLAEGTRAQILMILDLDHFKVVNDTFGHAAGDALLRVSTALRN
ncbi:diguanylate cyclase [bacterium M00.F.Ca.ET.228.01.1.1]|nr:diguanylate cyclase [bacterium M00.F.Ca.ET.228.01.1.1]TGS03670.1 diguanylate cyclase [bacterium M00.F.Ca.ET.191.01.1.1]TGU07711.1 diguanylate cyclase [bacterium M00.F.Ca.ET.155.01.1.1]